MHQWPPRHARAVCIPMPNPGGGVAKGAGGEVGRCGGEGAGGGSVGEQVGDGGGSHERTAEGGEGGGEGAAGVG